MSSDADRIAEGSQNTAPGDWTEPLWRRAAAFASRAHHGQFRRDGQTPYFVHVARVAMVVRDVFGCDEPAVLAAAYLHDTIEDTGTDYDEIAELAGRECADLVAALTKDMRLPEAARETVYDKQLAAADWRARLIKLADAYDNILDAVDPALSARAVERAHRAIMLAEHDRAAEIQTAVREVRSAIAQANSRPVVD